MISLAIDASTYRGTVAVLRDADVVGTDETAMRGATSEGLMPAVDAAITASRIARIDIQRVICGAGPGSFTSLRIATGIAKGLALGLGVPMFGVSSLALVAASGPSQRGRYVATLDALRDQWYAGVFARTDSGAIEEVAPFQLVDRNDVTDFAASFDATLIAPEVQPHAAGCALMLDAIHAAGPVNLDLWEPRYGRLAEAQVKWEAAHGRALGA